jgi:hypothetical protein
MSGETLSGETLCGETLSVHPFIVEEQIMKNAKYPHFLMAPRPRAMTYNNKIWDKIKHKYYFIHMTPNKCIRETNFKRQNENYEELLNLGGFWPHQCHHPWGNDPTMTDLDVWLGPNPPPKGV